jgi:hypothetical protein
MTIRLRQSEVRPDGSSDPDQAEGQGRFDSDHDSTGASWNSTRLRAPIIARFSEIRGGKLAGNASPKCRALCAPEVLKRHSMRNQPAAPAGDSWLGHPLIQVFFGFIAYLLARYNYVLFNTSIHVYNGNDFGKFYYAWHSWNVGWSLYTPTSATHMSVGREYLEFLDMNPPHFHLLIWPIASLPLERADQVWMIANLLAAFGSILVIMRELEVEIQWPLVLPLLTAALALGPTGATFITGQFTGLLMLGVALMWRAMRRERAVQAGIWLGLMLSIKPFLTLFLPVLAVSRQWRQFWVSIAAACCCFAVGLAVFGWHEHLAWIDTLRHVDWVFGAMNGSWEALLVRVFSDTPYAWPTLEASWLVAPLWVLGSAAVFVVTLINSRRDVDHMVASVILGALLVSPLGWVYYLWMASPPLAAIWRKRPPTLAVSGLLVLLVPFFLPLLSSRGPVFTLTIGSAYTWATVMLWWATVQAGMRPKDSWDDGPSVLREMSWIRRWVTSSRTR